MFTLLFNDFNDLFARKTGIYKKEKEKRNAMKTADISDYVYVRETE